MTGARATVGHVGALGGQTARTAEEFARVVGAWAALRAGHGPRTPNTDPALYAATIEALAADARPEVTMFGDGTGPRAGIMARRSIRPLLLRLGYLVVPSPPLRSLDVVYGGLITDGTAAAHRAIVDHFRRLLSAGAVDHVMVNHLPVDDELFAALTDRATFSTATLRGRPSRHWRFTFADGPFASTLARFSRKHRYNIRRADRLLVDRFDGDVALERVTAPGQVDAFVAAAQEITAAGYQGAIGAGLGRPAVQRPILAAAAGRGQLRCYLLRGGGRAIAFQAGITGDDVYHLRSTAFRPEHRRLSPGQVLLTRVLEDLAGAGVRTVDYGFGDAPYKRIYGTESWEEATVQLFSRSLPASTARLLDRAAGGATSYATRAAVRWRLSEPIRRRWRAGLSSVRARA